MLYLQYEVIYYQKPGSLRSPVQDYLQGVSQEEQMEIYAAIDTLREKEGKLLYPHAKHIFQKIWELRIPIDNLQHRIFYAILSGRKIILLHAFLKKSRKTPSSEIKKAYRYYTQCIS